MEIIQNKTFPRERDLYAARGVWLKNCRFDGAEDGESALKEARNVRLSGCYMNLRYPLWHDESVELENCEMTERCRAALWYTQNVTAKNVKMHTIATPKRNPFADKPPVTACVGSVAMIPYGNTQ